MTKRPSKSSKAISAAKETIRKAEFNSAIGFVAGARFWQIVAGPITLLLITQFFSDELQGYYYTFWSLIGLQSFFELALPRVVVSLTSHEYEHLKLDGDYRLTGKSSAQSRLASLLRISLSLYAWMAIAFGVIAGAVGYYFFSTADSAARVDWQGPWWSLVILTAAGLWFSPCLAILEGCNQMTAVYRLQFLRAVAGNIVIWIAIPLGAGLWTATLSVLIRLIAEIWLLAIVYRHLFSQLLGPIAGESINWRTEIWPFHWRMGLKSLFNYFNTDIINPVIFHYQGEAAAGQFGMTWQILISLQAVSSSWVRTRIAEFGTMVARRDFLQLDQKFLRVTRIAMMLFAAGGILYIVGLFGLRATGLEIAQRLLPPLPTALFVAALLIATLTECQWIYIHAHIKSPFLALTIFGLCCNGLLIWYFGKQYGAIGTAVAFFAMNACFHLPVWTWVWLRCRQQWHGESSIAASEISASAQSELPGPTLTSTQLDSLP